MGPRGHRSRGRHAPRPRQPDPGVRRSAGGRAPGERIGRAREEGQGGQAGRQSCQREQGRCEEARLRGGDGVPQDLRGVLVRPGPRGPHRGRHGHHGRRRLRIPGGRRRRGGEGGIHREAGRRPDQGRARAHHRALPRRTAGRPGRLHAGGAQRFPRRARPERHARQEAGRRDEAARGGDEEQEPGGRRQEGGAQGEDGEPQEVRGGSGGDRYGAGGAGTVRSQVPRFQRAHPRHVHLLPLPHVAPAPGPLPHGQVPQVLWMDDARQASLREGGGAPRAAQAIRRRARHRRGQEARRRRREPHDRKD
mmetsp:Transcript_37878/g.91338  ORF Transcript_37878/g.91338 Transcript_37878/m.91338 type:complete len:307 (-) Transcript_37878:1504-2424(-)